MSIAPSIGRTIEKEIFIKASPERVFEAFTSSAALANWWSMAEAELDLRPGGRWRCKWTSGDQVHGIFVAIDPPRRLVMDWDDDPNGSAAARTWFEERAEVNEVAIYGSDVSTWDGTGLYAPGVPRERNGLPPIAIGIDGVSVHPLGDRLRARR